MMKFENINPHFFQPLIHGFDSNFAIPKSFMKYIIVEEKDDKKKVKLKNKTGKIWDVEVDYNDDNNKLEFKEGWKNFCEENKLHVGDFLVFRHARNLDFDVFIFDHGTCCERQHMELSTYFKESPSYSTQAKEEESQGEEVKTIGGHPCCHLVVKPYSLRASFMYLPKDFTRINGLDKIREVTLIDTRGRQWIMKTAAHYGGGTQIGGWASFQRANNLKTGDQFFLELIQSRKKTVFKFHVC